MIFENVSPKGFFWLNMKNFEISVLTANSRYLQTAALNDKKSKSNLPTTFNVDDKEIPDPTQIADHFCAYFTNIGPKVANSIPPSLTSYLCFLSWALVNSLYLQPTTEQEITEICTSFSGGTTAGYDQITMNVLIKEKVDLIV